MSRSFSPRFLFDSGLRLFLAASFFLLAVRMVWTGTDGYAFLLWNTALAIAPYGFAVLLERESGKGAPRRVLFLSLFLFWLFFFPNAPYIATDFIHAPWAYPLSLRFVFDTTLIASFFATGLLFGMGSLFLVHRALRRRLGKSLAGVTIGVSIVLSGVGIYLGRFLRWNSWDVFVNPIEVLHDTALHYADPLWFEHALLLSFLFSLFIAVSYGLFLGAYRFLGQKTMNEGDGDGL